MDWEKSRPSFRGGGRGKTKKNVTNSGDELSWGRRFGRVGSKTSNQTLFARKDSGIGGHTYTEEEKCFWKRGRFRTYSKT